MSSAILLMLALSAAPDAPERTITVTGDAEVRVPPNEVQLWLAVASVDKVLKQAKDDNDQRVKKTLSTLVKLGIESKDVQTDFVSIEPRWDNYQRTRTPDAYEVSKSIVVTLRDVSRFEVILQAVLDAGTNRVEGLEFRTTELRKHRDAARAKALKAAQEKAIAMARELDLKVGKARTISEFGGGYGFGGGRGARMAMQAQNVSQTVGGAEGASEAGFAPGLISVRATVQVTFDVE
jgi:uncharacterized protein YggE